MPHFDPDQPRDEHGRWVDEFGNKTEIVTTIKDAGSALKAAATDYTEEAAIYEQALELNRKALEARPEFEEKLKQVNAILGGIDTGVNMKRIERIAEKAKKEYGGDVNSVTDPIRSTIIIKSSGEYTKAIDAFKRAGAVKVKMQEGESFLGYRGVLAKFKLSNGIQSEVQANYPEMLYAKGDGDIKSMIGEAKFNEIKQRTKIESGLGHKYYEDFRKYQDKISAGSLTISEAEFLQDVKTKSMKYYSNFY